jgi:hypothetical protein
VRTMPDDPSPAARVAAVALRLEDYLRRYDAARDERAIFAFLYLLITRNLAAQLPGDQAGFRDPGWVAALAESFGRRYFAAMDAIDQVIETARVANRQVAARDLTAVASAPWADAYLAIRDGAYVFESLLFPMMAHLSYDLPLALLEVGLEAEDSSHVVDFHRMNRVLADATPTLEREVAARYNPLLPIFDKAAGRYGVFFSNYGIRATRSLGWYNAYRLRDPLSAEDARGSIERSTASFVAFVRRPDERGLRWLVRVMRLILPRYHRWPGPIGP